MEFSESVESSEDVAFDSLAEGDDGLTGEEFVLFGDAGFEAEEGVLPLGERSRSLGLG